ncbi:MAG: hypothetical protein LBM77_03350 [Spirochaetaceae bacterium]|jgi:hypothetical protein|nr:hypothetical protein [Spirochaetaceae bacterium]
MKKSKFFSFGIAVRMLCMLMVGISLGTCLVACATTDPNAPPPYNFDGTSWAKTENYELSFTATNWKVVFNGKTLASGDYKMDVCKVSGSTLDFGNTDWWNFWGHAAGTWTLKSGTPGQDNLNETVWTREAKLTLSFANGKMIAKDGIYPTTANKDGDSFKSTAKQISVTYSDGTAKGTYIVDGNTLTVTTSGMFGASRLEGSPWTKQ